MLCIATLSLSIQLVIDIYGVCFLAVGVVLLLFCFLNY